MQKKLWSISTTLRNPYRMQDFLRILSTMEGEVWNRSTQSQFQIRLIQSRFYTPTFDGLSDEQQELLENPMTSMTFEQAEDIFQCKGYDDDPAQKGLRGRTSYNPLQKMGLTFIVDGRIGITALGKRFAAGEIEMDDFCFRSFLQWQYPNPLSADFSEASGYNAKPFICTLLLIRSVNRLCRERGLKEKGISKTEFGIFALSLTNYRDIEAVAGRVLDFRKRMDEIKEYQKQKEFEERFIREYLADYTNVWVRKKGKQNCNIPDYTDNAIRYFRATKYIYIRGDGYYVDLEPRRHIELEKLFQCEDGSARKFDSKTEFIQYMCNPATYLLPWENVDELQKIAARIVEDIHHLQAELDVCRDTYIIETSVSALEAQIFQLREIRSALQSILQKQEYADVEKIDEVIHILRSLSDRKKQKELPEKPSILLEKYILLALNIINDAIRIRTNAPVGDDNELTFTAPGNVPDMECEYEDFAGICEVTLLTGRDQWYNEGQPVMRHLRDYEKKHPEKPGYCLFIAPKFHPDTLNTFWFAIKYEFEGKRQCIIPLSISQMADFLELVKDMKRSGRRFRHSNLRGLYDKMVNVENVSDSREWCESLPTTFVSWKQAILEN